MLTYRGRLVPFYLLVAIALLLRVMVTGQRLAAGRDGNAELADGLHLPRVRIGLPGRAWLVPGRRRRVLVISLGAALTVLVYVVVVTAILFETGR